MCICLQQFHSMLMYFAVRLIQSWHHSLGVQLGWSLLWWLLKSIMWNSRSIRDANTVLEQVCNLLVIQNFEGLVILQAIGVIWRHILEFSEWHLFPVVYGLPLKSSWLLQMVQSSRKVLQLACYRESPLIKKVQS